MLDRIADSISKLLDINVTSSELIKYDQKKIVTAKRIDEIKK